MLRIEDYNSDLRNVWSAVQAQGGGEIAFGKGRFVLPGGTTLPCVNNVSLRGEGAATEIVLQGDGDFTIGTANDEVQNFRMEGINIVSDAERGGWGLRLRKGVRSVLRDVTIDPIEKGWRNEFGLWIDKFDDITLDNVTANPRTKALLMNGYKDQSYGADLYVTGGCKFTTMRTPESNPWEVAIHIAGACGGIYLDSADVIYSAVNLLIDTQIAGVSNREIFLGAGVYFDSAGEDCVRLGPKACSTFHCSGTWFASAGITSGGYPNGNGLNVHSDNGQLVGQLSGVKAFNCKGTGLALGGGRWIVGGGSAVHDNGGYGLHRSNTNAQIQRGSILTFNNAMGDFAGF